MRQDDKRHDDLPKSPTDHREPGAPQVPPIMSERESVNLAKARGLVRRLSGLFGSRGRDPLDHALLKLVLQEYAELAARYARAQQQHELEISRLQVERRWVFTRLQQLLVDLRAVGTAPLPADPPAQG